MSVPTDDQIRELFARLRKLTTKAELADLERRMLAAANRDRAGTNVADGYPAGTLGGAGGGASIVVEDEDGNPDRVAVTSVEAAALARLDGQRDRHREHTEAAAGWLVDAVQSLGALGGRLDVIDRLASLDPGEIEPKRCQVCAEHRHGKAPVWEHKGTVGGRLDRSVFLCSDCYWFVNRYGRLPSGEEWERHDRTGRWRARAS